jgi:hypothetical protein
LLASDPQLANDPLATVDQPVSFGDDQRTEGQLDAIHVIGPGEVSFSAGAQYAADLVAAGASRNFVET